MTRLVVHIGAQRTASAGFHKSLYDNAEILLRHGVLVPQSGRHDQALSAVRHQLLAWSVDPAADSRGDPGVWDALARELAAAKAHTAFVSSELLAAVAADPVTGPLLKKRLREVADDVTVVFLARDQLDLLNGLYCQQVRALELTCDFDGYVADSPDLDRHDLASFEPWYTDDRVDFRAMAWDPYAGADALPALLGLAGIEVDQAELRSSAADTEADRLGPVGIEANRLLGCYLRGRFPDFQPAEPAMRRLRRKAAVAGQAMGFDVGEFWGWRSEQAAEAAARYATGNQAFARGAFGADWALAAPVDKARQVAELVELEPALVNRVHRYLIDMEEVLHRVRRRESAA